MKRQINSVLWPVVVCLGGSLAPVTLAQDHRYSVTLLTPLAGHSSLSTNAINNRGDVVGVSYGSPVSNQQPYLYRAGVGVQPLPFPPGFAFSVPTDINDDGTIVGYAQSTWSDETNPVAWRYQDGQFTLLAPDTFANNINNAGTVVGRTCSDANGYLTCFFIATPDSLPAIAPFGQARTYPSSNWRFVDVNDPGQIAYTTVYPGPFAFLRQPDGTQVQITPPPPPFVRTFTWAINNSAQIIGRWEYNIGSQYYSRAFIWSEVTGATVIGIPRNHVRPKGVNNLGHVVGESGGNQDSYLDMWLWTPQRGSEDIEPLIDPALQIIATGLSGINDRGQIIGHGISQLLPADDVFFILSPITNSCPANFNQDTVVDPDDLADFITCFFLDVQFPGICAQADFNADGFRDPDDLADFITVFFLAIELDC